MPWFDDWNFGADDDPDLRKAAVDRHLKRVGLSLETSDKLGTTPDTPAELERRKQRARDQLAKEDALFGNHPMASIPDHYKIPKPRFEVGDPEGDADID